MANVRNMDEVLERDRGILEHFGMQLVALTAERCEMQAVVKPELINAAGLAHGGLLYAIADTACAYATGATGTPGATVTSGFNFNRPARAGMRLRCVAEVLTRGRRLVTVSARVTDHATDQLLAHGTFTFMLLTE